MSSGRNGARRARGGAGDDGQGVRGGAGDDGQGVRGGAGYGRRGAGGVRAGSARALLLVAPLVFGGCGALLGISEVEPSDGPSGAAGGVGGTTSGSPGQGGSGGMRPPGMAGRPPGEAGRGGTGTGGNPIGGSAGEGASGGTGGNTGGTGGDTGGTGGTTGGTGGTTGGTGGSTSGTGGTGGAPVCKGDFNEPNNSEGTATPLGEEGGDELSPCTPLLTIGGVAGLDSDDWFFFSGRTGACQQSPQPLARLSGLVFAELCYFLQPADGFVASCAGGAKVSSDVPGYTGCCGQNEAQLSYNGDNAEGLIRIRPSQGATECMAYEMDYRY